MSNGEQPGGSLVGPILGPLFPNIGGSGKTGGPASQIQVLTFLQNQQIKAQLQAITAQQRAAQQKQALLASKLATPGTQPFLDPSPQTRDRIDRVFAAILSGLDIFRGLQGIFQRTPAGGGGGPIVLSPPIINVPPLPPLPRFPFPFPTQGGVLGGAGPGGTMPSPNLVLAEQGNGLGLLQQAIGALGQVFGSGGGVQFAPPQMPSMIDFPGVDFAPQGSTCISPRTTQSTRLPSRVDVQSVDAAGNTRCTTFKNMGRPVLYSGDFAAAKRVRKVAGRARRAAGGR